MTRLDLDALRERLDGYRRRLFRLETLPAYAVTSDGDDYHRHVRGEPEPDWVRKEPWLDVLRADHAAGKIRYRVRVFSEELTDYERYACEWGYALNVEAGEDVRVLHRGEHGLPAGLTQQDFWTVDDDTVATMIYDDHGGFVAAEIQPASAVSAYRAARDEAWAAAEPFATWWARHPELRRRAIA